MNELNRTIFDALFRDACLKCFGFPLKTILTETDSKLLSAKIFESTGLVIGPKSIKNYSAFVLNNNKESRNENPSAATLDTLARYVLDAPYTDEIQRKDKESHFPYWFQYRSRFSDSYPDLHPKRPVLNKTFVFIATLLFATVIMLLFIVTLHQKSKNEIFSDNFNSVSADSLKKKGWIIRSMDTTWWKRRDELPGDLTLYTLKGDNWANNENAGEIKNLIIRKISSDCFMVEIHLTEFYPTANWQQAGIILSEDSTFKGKMIRLSISYNDFFGGYEKPPEIIIQGLSSTESGLKSKPEEFAHISLFSLESEKKDLAYKNLAKSALKIEKKGDHFRFLYSYGPTEGFAFKEAVNGDFDIQLRYVGIFAIQGWAPEEHQIPVHFESFTSISLPCGN